MPTFDWTELKDKSKKLGLGDWSYNKVKMVNSCPLLFQETYLRPHVKITNSNKQFKEVPTKVGIMLHDVFETCIKTPTLSVEQAWLPLTGAHNLLAAELKLANRMQPAVTKLVQRLRIAIARYQLNTHMELKLNPVAMLGYVDFVGLTEDGKSALLLDYKTHAESPTRAESVAKQLSFYTLCLMLEYPAITSVKSGCVYIPEESIKYQLTVYRDRLFELEGYWFNILSTAVEMLTNFKELNQGGADSDADFPYFKGDSCTWCTKLDCPAKQKPLKRKSKKQQQQAKEKTVQLGV